MSHIVESCPLKKLNGGLSRLHSADEDAVSWLTSYGFMTCIHEKEEEEEYEATKSIIGLCSRPACTFFKS